MLHYTLLFIALSFSCLVRADVEPMGEAEKQALHERAQQLKNQANTLRQESETRYATEQKECWKKFLVNACMDKAKTELIDKKEESRQLEKEAREIERKIKRQAVAARQAKRNANVQQQ